MNISYLTNNQTVNISNSSTSNGYIPRNFNSSQIIAVAAGASAILLAIVIFVCLFIYQRYKMRIQKKQAHSLTSNNPCYVSEPSHEYESNSNHAHCNMSVLTDFYDIDDLNSLDNDSFLNSLENAIFVGYMNHNRQSYSVDHSLTKLSNQTSGNSTQSAYCNNGQLRKSSNNNSMKHSSHNAVHLRSKKSKRAVSILDSNTDHIRPRNKSETTCEITRSTSNLISSKMCLTTSTDSVCNSSRGSNLIPEVSDQYKLEEHQTSKETNIDNKTESSTDSRTSVNSSSAMMSSYMAENNPACQILPDLINSSLPKSAKRHKRVSSAYSNNISKDDYIFSTTTKSGQILDPLRAGQTFHFSNETADTSTTSRHERHLSHSFGISNVGVFEYNVSI